MFNSQLNLSEYKPVNYLWTEFAESLGFDKASKAINQAIDIQIMTGSVENLPVLFIETCGIGLLNFESVKIQTGLSLYGKSQVLIISKKRKLFQILQKSL